jgi:hypothetical protein
MASIGPFECPASREARSTQDVPRRDKVAIVESGSASDGARLAQAESLLGGRPDAQARKRFRRRLLLAVGAVLVAGAAGIVTALVLSDNPSPRRSEASAAQETIAMVLYVAGLVVVVVAMVFLWRAMRRAGGWRAPHLALSRAQRKDLLAQVRGLRPADPARLPLTRNLALRVVGQRWLVLMSVGLCLTTAAQWISSPSAWRGAFTIVCVVFLVGAAPFIKRDARRAQRFLAAHPPTD